MMNSTFMRGIFLSALVLLFIPQKLLTQCCDYTLILQDEYGDGWNGAELEVFINAESFGVFSAEEFGNNVLLPTCNGEEITLNYSTGEYENENSYLLLASGGVLVHSDGPEPSEGESGPFIADCDLEPAPGASPCSAMQLTPDECISADNSAVVGSGYTPNCSEYDGGDIWYSIGVPESGNLVFQTADNGGMNDTGIQLWFGEECFSIEDGPCDDDGGTGYFSFITVSNLTPGEIIYVQLWGYGGAEGSFELCALDPGIVELEQSLLPIFLIETNGEEILDEPKIDASLKVIYNGLGEVNFLADEPENYNGQIGIEIRGATSAGYPQTPYSFETRDALGENNNVSLVDMPEENDWVLLSNYNDKVLMRNLLASHLFERMGEYAPRVRLCEVQINGDYQGIYAFGEKIKVDDGRLDIATLNVTENDGDDVTGGYILELNYHNSQNSWELNNTSLNHPDFDVHLVYKYPKPEVITEPQKEYIASYVDSMETALYGDNFMSMDEGYRNYMDAESFIDYFLLNELSRNNDGFKKSRYFHKDKASNGGLFKAGPSWDFDWAWKDMYTCEIFENQDGSGWAHLINDCPTDNYSPDWYVRLQQDSTYVNQQRCQWDEYREEFLNQEYINNYVDSIALLVSAAQERHFQKWPILGLATAAPEVEPLPDSYAGEVAFFKEWINLRINWLDENLPGSCVDPIVGVEEIAMDARVYPNPNNGQFTLECIKCRGRELVLLDVFGQEVWAKKNHHPRTEIQLDLPKGVYVLKAGGEYLQKMVIE
ncbi:MAG: hypothetical protein ACI888_000581 [Flavobacteriales bacterium]|jgi:hypothetical protein